MAVENKDDTKMHISKRVIISLFWLMIAVCATLLLGIITILIVTSNAELGDKNLNLSPLIVWVTIYCMSIGTLGILALFGNPKWLYRKKRHFIAVFLILGFVGFSTLGAIDDQSRSISAQVEALKERQNTTDKPLKTDGSVNEQPAEDLSIPRNSNTQKPADYNARTLEPNQSQSTHNSTLCFKEDLYYGTVYEKSAELDYGQSQVVPGKEGIGEVCYPTEGEVTNRVITPPVDERRIEGTRGAPTYSIPKPNYSRCLQYSGSSAYQACVMAVNAEHKKKYGY